MNERDLFVYRPTGDEGLNRRCTTIFGYARTPPRRQSW